MKEKIITFRTILLVLVNENGWDVLERIILHGHNHVLSVRERHRPHCTLVLPGVDFCASLCVPQLGAGVSGTYDWEMSLEVG